MGTCKDCKWWGRDFRGTCAFVDTVHAETPATLFQIEAQADDDQGLYALLRTGPDFGCIHFEDNGRAADS